MEHSFNIEVAKKLGIAPAVILNSLYFWIEKNRTDERNFYDGAYWTFMSRKGYCRYFPYLTERQIEYALRKLIDEGLVITGNYNKSTYDRTLWYSITKLGYCILQNCEMEETKNVNGNTEIVKPIPDNKTISKTDNKTLSTKEGKAQKKKSYKDVYSDPVNVHIKDALVKFVNACKGMNYTPRVSTVESFAETLRNNAGESKELAMKMVEQSISKGWKAIYPLKGYKMDQYKTSGEEDELARNEDGSLKVY